MKRLLLIMAIILLISVPQVMAFSNALFVGGRYRSDSGFVTTVGFAKALGDGFWNFSYVDASGPYKSLATEFGYGILIPKCANRLTVGVLAGPNSDWAHTTDTITYVSYLLGAAGFWVNWDTGPVSNGLKTIGTLGVWGYGKYKFNMDPQSETLIQKGWIVGIGGYYKF
jgi:hypothetical protein